jgi:transposase InsO family protein
MLCKKRHTPEEIVAKLRQVEVSTGRGTPVADAIRSIGVTEQLRDELLNVEIFNSLREAQVLIEAWRRHYNAVRPHSALGHRAPAPEVFVPALAARPAAPPRPTRPAPLPLVPRPTLN